jgi:hypothetical protein
MATALTELSYISTALMNTETTSRDKRQETRDREKSLVPRLFFPCLVLLCVDNILEQT